MPSPVTIGSDPACDFPLAFEDIAEKHCRLTFDAGGTWVEDLDSASGTFVRDERVPAGERWRVEPGSKLRLGSSAILSWRDVQSLRPAGEPVAQGVGYGSGYEVNSETRGSVDPPYDRITSAFEPAEGYAGFWKRFFAVLIDGILTGIIGFIIGFAWGFLAVEAQLVQTQGGLMLISNLLGILMSWLYFAGFESSKHQATPGKMALGIKVTDRHGQPVSFGQATGRHFGKIISGLLLLIGYIMAGFTDKKQALHDMLAGCLVINESS